MTPTNDNVIRAGGCDRASGRSPGPLVFGSYPRFSDLGGQASNRAFRPISEIQRDWWHGQTFAANRQAFNRRRDNETFSESVAETVGDGGENGCLCIRNPDDASVQNGMGGIEK